MISVKCEYIDVKWIQYMDTNMNKNLSSKQMIIHLKRLKQVEDDVLIQVDSFQH